MRVLTPFLTFLIVTFVAPSASAFDYNRAINLSGKQRMLTQKMSKEALLVALGVDAEKNGQNLKKTRDLFDKTLKGLKDGDADLGLDATKKPKIRGQLDKIGALWTEFDGAISAIINGGSASKEQITVIAEKNLPLLKEMNKAVKFYEADAAGGGVNPALAKAINLAGRQRMLTQKMSKEFLLVAYGHEVDANKANLQKTVSLFDKTLNGLVDGNADIGLSAAPTPELKTQLEKVKGLWAEFRDAVEATPSDATKRVVAEKNLPLLKEMNAAVKMFEGL